MADYILSCCSTADLSKEHFEARDIKYICFHYYLDEVHYRDDLGQSMSFDKFYAAMTAGAETRTSQINASEFVAFFEPFLQEGKDIIHISLSSGISGVYNSAILAKEALQEKYPERNIHVIDSLAASSGYGLLMDKAADLRDAGMSVDDLAAWLEEHKLELQHWFFSSDLTFFIKGGRVSKTAGAVGTVLHICPLLNVDFEGHLISREKVRTKTKVIKRIVEKMAENAAGGENYSGKCYISQSACHEDARAVADLIEAGFPQLTGRVEINNIGTTIGSHTGPGTVALFFWGNKRID